MIGPGADARVLVATRPVDFPLAALVKAEHGGDPPVVAYVYAPDRKGERPAEHLRGFAGVLQVDGYAGYRALARSNQVQLVLLGACTSRLL